MPTIGETARITTSLPGSAVDTIEERAWLIWTRFRNATRNDPTTTPDGAGVRVIGAVKPHARFLYPTEVLWGDEQAERDFMRPIYDYLRGTGNARVIRRSIAGSPYVSEWWLSDEWLDIAQAGKVSAPRTPKDKLSKAERKLSATEAGEDREPAPVTVTTFIPVSEPVQRAKEPRGAVGGRVMNAESPSPCLFPGCGQTFRTPAGLGGHKRSHNISAQRIAAAKRWGKHICVPCGKEFATGPKLGGHKARAHRALTAQVEGKTATRRDHRRRAAVEVPTVATPAPTPTPATMTPAQLLEAFSAMMEAQQSSSLRQQAEAANATIDAIRDAFETKPLAQAVAAVLDLLPARTEAV